MQHIHIAHAHMHVYVYVVNVRTVYVYIRVHACIRYSARAAREHELERGGATGLDRSRLQEIVLHIHVCIHVYMYIWTWLYMYGYPRSISLERDHEWSTGAEGAESSDRPLTSESAAAPGARSIDR